MVSSFDTHILEVRILVFPGFYMQVFVVPVRRFLFTVLTV